MNKIVIFISCFLCVLSCKEQSKNDKTKEVNISETLEILETLKENKEEHNVIQETALHQVVDKDTLPEDQSFSFVDYKKDGLILPATYEVYNNSFNSIGQLNIDSILPIKIIRKSLKKHPKFLEQDYCEWSNFIELNYENDTIIVFGKSILEISFTEMRVLNDSNMISLILAENFTMEAADDDGLTGCDDFSYIFIKPEKMGYSYIQPAEDKGQLGFGMLAHDEGMSERISTIQVNQDTLILSVNVGYQEGTGGYNMKIFKEKKWYYTISDRKREY